MQPCKPQIDYAVRYFDYKFGFEVSVNSEFSAPELKFKEKKANYRSF